MKGIEWLKRADASRHVNLVRYALNRIIDVFVIGPAAVLLIWAVATWAGGASPFRVFAQGYVDTGEAFRGSPPGYVRVPVMPVAPELPTTPPLTSAAIAALPHHLIKVDEYAEQLALGFAGAYLVGITLGIVALILLRGKRLIDDFFRWFERGWPH